MIEFKTARLPTPESRTWERDKKARTKHIKDAMIAFKHLLKNLQPYADQSAAKFPGNSTEALTSQGRLFMKLVKDAPEAKAYLDTWISKDTSDPASYSWRNQTLYQARNTLLYPRKFPLRDAILEVGKQADKGFEALALEESQGPLREILPDDLRAFLPQKVVVEVDPTGTIKKITDRFEAEYETLDVKIGTMHHLVKKYNAITQQVKKDMKSGDELTRMAALITAIMMETGIRPGNVGNGFVKVVNGADEAIETFGAITLGPAHVKFVRDNFVSLGFIGKKGTLNWANLTDTEVIRYLNAYVEQAKKGDSKFIFTTTDGAQFTYTDLQRYFKLRFASFSPTDFRKLKATDTVLSVLRDKQQGLYARIKEFAGIKKDDLKDRVLQEVLAVVRDAYTTAQQNLSHESLTITIDNYINPEILLRFLSQGRIEDSLTDAILGGKSILSFNTETFVAQALKSSSGASTLQNLLQSLEEGLKVEGVSVF